MGSIVARCATAQRTLVDINDDLCGSRNFRPWIWPLLVDDIRVFRRISSPEFKDQADAFNFLSGALRVMTHYIGARESRLRRPHCLRKKHRLQFLIVARHGRRPGDLGSRFCPSRCRIRLLARAFANHGSPAPATPATTSNPQRWGPRRVGSDPRNATGPLWSLG